MVSEGQESGSRLSGGSWIRVSPEVIVKLSEGLTGARRFASRWLTHMLLAEGLSSSPRGPLLGATHNVAANIRARHPREDEKEATGT